MTQRKIVKPYITAEDWRKIMEVTIYNGKYNDSIVFDIEELTEESRQDILLQVHTRGWDDKDCWSEVER